MPRSIPLTATMRQLADFAKMEKVLAQERTLAQDTLVSQEKERKRLVKQLRVYSGNAGGGVAYHEA